MLSYEQRKIGRPIWSWFSSFELTQHKNHISSVVSKTVRLTGKSILVIKYLSFLSTTFVANIYHSHECLASFERDVCRNGCRSSYSVSVTVVRILQKLECVKLQWNFPVSNVIKIVLSSSETKKRKEVKGKTERRKLQRKWKQRRKDRETEEKE